MPYKGLIIILFTAIYTPTFISLAERFLAADSYYSHGFLVPLVCAYLSWRKRRKLKQSLSSPTPKSGLALLVAGLLLHFISTILKINFGSYLSLPIVLFAMVSYLFGKMVAGELLFPISFLVFMLPLPSVMIIAVSFKMKMLAAHLATQAVNMMQISAVRDGSTIYLPNGSNLLVGDPCSGLRSLISLLALGAVFTQFVQGSRLKKKFLFLSAIPIALISNIFRIISLILVTYVYGERVALRFFHDFSGMLVFVLAFVGLAIVMRSLKCQIIRAI